MSYLKSVVFLLFFIPICLCSQVVENDSTNITSSVGVPDEYFRTKSTFYIQTNYYNTFRKLEDKSVFKKYAPKLNENPINTAGFELGTQINLNEHIHLSLGFNFFSAGEENLFEDALSDSTFYYKNKYRVIGIPLKFNIEYGNQLKWFAFAGIIPSSTLHNQYTSKYTNPEGKEFKNDVEIIKNDLAFFQIAGIAGTGIKYDFSNAMVYTYFEFRQHLSNTFQSTFVDHKLYGYGLGVGLSFKL